MCGIFGYIGKQKKVDFLLEGLGRLEYRGYDSCGLSCFDNGRSLIRKQQGRIEKLKTEIDSQKSVRFFDVGIAHTRWATHGKPNKINAHPHLDSTKTISIVHNGIIENFSELRQDLRDKGCVFKSQTDTEVIVHLIGYYYKENLKQAVLEAVKHLEGSFALCVISKDDPDMLLGVRKDSPLVVGIAKEGYYLASDSIALVPYTDKEIVLNDKELVILKKDSIEISDFDGKARKPAATQITISSQDAQKGKYEHYMLKEMHEQPDILKRILAMYCVKGAVVLPEAGLSASQIKNAQKIYIVACGTAYHAGLVFKYFLEKISKIDIEIDVSSEFRYRDFQLKDNSIVIAVSQSGETADTLAAVKRFKARGAKIVSICNVLGSSLTRESDGHIYTACGPEIGVASTKAYTSQVLCLMLLAIYTAGVRKEISQAQTVEMLKDFSVIPQFSKEILTKGSKTIERIAGHYSKIGCFLFLGRGINFPTALEGALKLKELSYIPAEGYPAGEMKHGPIALIDEYRAVVCIALKDELYDKMFSNIQEIKARKGRVMALITAGDKKMKYSAEEYIEIPQVKEELTPVLAAIPLQLLAYYIAKNLGHDIDKPRNLAKSVTVE